MSEVELTTELTSCACTLRPLNPRHKFISLTLHRNGTFRFGRRADCEVAFPSDFRISSIHASLLLDRDRVYIEDTSVNGTYVNGERVPKNTRRALNSGDHIYFVIPDQSLLQAGYMGSLSQNFVGYVFVSEEAQRAHSLSLASMQAALATGSPSLQASSLQAPPTAAAAAGGDWQPPRARGLVPRSAPGASTDRIEPDTPPMAAVDSLRQTSDMRAWIEARTREDRLDDTTRGNDAAPPHHLSLPSPVMEPPTRDRALGGSAVAAAPTSDGAAADEGGAYSSLGTPREEQLLSEHVSFAAWWLAEMSTGWAETRADASSRVVRTGRRDSV